MIVLKFGGSSVAGANEVEQVLAVLSEQKKPMAVVVSALGGITDELHALGKLAANGDASYADRLKKVEERHVHMVQALIPVSKRSAILSATKQIINKLETILEGTYMIRELSPKTLDTLLSFGEILSHKIIAEAAKAKGIDAIAKNAQDLIVTFQSLGRTLVDYKKNQC
jgi:aspartokinase/homoserine dehydrogenase 1